MLDNSSLPPEAAHTPSTNGSSPHNALILADKRTGLDSANGGPAHSPSPPPYSHSASYSSKEENEGFDIHRLMGVLARRWPAMLAVLVCAILLGVASNSFSKPIYQSQATLEVTPPQRGGSTSDVPGLENFTGGDSTQSTSIDTQIELLRGGPIFGKAMDKLEPRERLTLNEYVAINVFRVGETNLLSVAAQSYDPKAASDLANAVCDEYVAASLEKNRSNSRGAVEYVQKQLLKVRERLSGAQTSLKQFKQRTGIFDISSEATALGGKLAAMQQSLEEAQSERAAAQAKFKGLQGVLSRIPADKTVATGVAPNPAVLEFQNKLTQLELERAINLRDYTPTSYKIVNIDNQIKAIRAQLQTQAKTVISGWAPDPSRAPLANEAAATQSQLWSMDAKINALQSQTAEAHEQLAQLPEKEFRYTQLATDTQVLQQQYQMLNERLQTLLLGEVARVADGRIVFKANPNPGPIAPNKHRTLLYAATLGLLGAIGLALMLDMLDNRIYSDEEAQRITNLPVLAHVPFVRNEGEMSLMNISNEEGLRTSPMLESFRMLRANIAFSAVDRPINSLVVTSSVPNEGKSHSAFNLAIAAATSGERVILVDLDLRRPTVHTLCGLSNEKGFSSVASNRCTLEEALQESSISGLRVLTSGPVHPNPFKLLNSQSARAIIEQLAHHADLVVIDTPPMLGMADARLVGSWVDGTLLVVSCREVRKREISRSVELLMQGGIEVVGTLLTKMSAGGDGYYNYNYYGYRPYGNYLDKGEAADSQPKPELQNH